MQNSFKHILGNILYVLKLIWKKDKILYLFLCIESILGVVVSFLSVSFSAFIVQEVSSGNVNKVFGTCILFMLVMVVTYAAYSYAAGAKYWRYQCVNIHSMVDLFAKTLDSDYDIMESENGQILYQRALNSTTGGDFAGIPHMIPSITQVIISVLGILSYVVLLVQLHPVVPVLLIILSFINYYVLKYVKDFIEKHKEQYAKLDKKIQYIENRASDFSFAKDIRLFSMQKWIIEKQERLFEERLGWDKKIEEKNLLTIVVGSGINFIRDGLAYVYLIYMAVQGRISVSDFVWYFGIITGFSGWITQFMNHINEVRVASFQIADLRRFLEIASTKEETEQKSNVAKDKLENVSIQFQNVSFSYGEQDIFKDFNLNIRAGEKIALVGLNGAGKTTLIKLLCGLYKPTSGRILLNDMDITKIDQKKLSEFFSVVFQDTYILPFKIVENVAMCKEEQADRERVWQCLEYAGLGEYFRSLEDNIDSFYTKTLDEKGVFLSGGQQQNLLLARALYKNAPVLILDEPTAALDALAESKIYSRYNELADKKTSIFISHRLASAKFCDSVILLENGQIVEKGTHDELVQKNGKYAELYELQSKYYRSENEEGGEVVAEEEFDFT